MILFQTPDNKGRRVNIHTYACVPNLGLNNNNVNTNIELGIMKKDR